MKKQQADKPKQKNRIAARSRITITILLVLILVTMAVISVVLINGINDKSARNLVRAYSIEASEGFYSYISEGLTLARKAAVSRAISGWIIDPYDELKKAAAFNEMMDYTGILENVQLNIVIDRSIDEYRVMEESVLEDFVSFSRLDRLNADDAWYFECAASDNEYTLNVDIDSITRTWRLWINHKIMTEGNFAGVVSYGLQIPDVFLKVFSHDNNSIRGYIIDKDGIIRLDSTAYGNYWTENKRNIRVENNDSTFTVSLNSYLERMDAFFNNNSEAEGNPNPNESMRQYPDIVRLAKGPYKYAAIDPIKNADWSVLVFYNPRTLSSMARLLPFVIIMAVALLLYVISGNIMKRRTQVVQLHRANEYNRLLLDATPLACRIWDKDFSIIHCNEEAVKLFKLKDKQEYMDRFFELSPEYQSDGSLSSEATFLHFKMALAEGKCTYEWMHHTIDGVPLPAEITLVRVPYEDDYVVAGYTRDLREHKQMMEEIEKQGHLLNAALNQAQEASQAKTSFLANMSHEMRTPLNAVIGLSELSLAAGGINEEALLNLEKINNAGMTLLSTVNDILDISKIEAGKFELNAIQYDTPSLINDAINQSIMRIGDKPITFILDIQENLPSRLYGDDLRIRQIFNNLLSNAFKYTLEGTVELGIRCEKYSQEEFILTAWVRDTGPGIRSEDMDRLFTDYAMMETKTNRKIEGTGLGLAITKRIAEMMGGSISVESEFGKGSVFTVKILQRYVSDVVIGQEVVNSLKSFNYSDQKRRWRSGMMRANIPYAKVLIVDDVDTNLDVARGMMRPYGMQVDCVNSGQEAIDAIRAAKVRYNAVFMDHMMPGMDGIEATRIIREEIDTEYAKTVPIIALTANAIVGNEAMFLSKGFQAFISKPIELGRLDSVIREWVRDKELEKKLKQANAEGTAIPEPTVEQQDGIKKTGYDKLILTGKITGLDMTKGLDIFGGNVDTYLYVLGSYVTNTKKLLDKTQLAANENLTDFAIHIHGIKSSNRAIGASLLGDKAEALENAAKESNIDFVMKNYASFHEDMVKLIGGLEEYLLEIAPENIKQKKDSPDPEMLKKILAACEAYDMDGVDEAMGVIEAYEYSSDNGLVVWLRENIKQMNFRQIKDRLGALIISM